MAHINISSHLFLAIDAGGTSCKARLVDENKNILSQHQSGPANIRLGVEKVFAEITICAQHCLEKAGLSQSEFNNLSVAIGMAGASHAKDKVEELKKIQNFKAFTLCSDTYIACLGAHDGQDGAIIISGTGSAGCYIQKGEQYILGGHGFMLGDQGSGADLGRRALRYSLLAFDGLIPSSPLSQKIMASFDNSPALMVKWSETARPADYGEFAPICVEAYHKGDNMAKLLITQSLDDLSLLIEQLYTLTQKPVGIIGGLGNSLKDALMQRLGQEKILAHPVDGLYGATLLAFKNV